MIPLTISADIHTHSISSGHYSTDTITSMLMQAKASGLKLLGISEHGPGIPESCTVSYFRSLKYAPRLRMGIQVLYGAEVNILDGVTHWGYKKTAGGKGEILDLEDEVMAGLDYCIAGMHPPCYTPGTREEHTAAYIRAMENPHVRFISHPEDVKYPADYEALVLAAKRCHVIPEINSSSLSPDGYRGEPRAVKANMCEILSLCKKHELCVLLSSDSHGHTRVGDVTYSIDLLKEMHFPSELVINRCAEDLQRWLGIT